MGARSTDQAADASRNGDLPVDEQQSLELIRALRETGNLHPLIQRLREGHVGPERARDALRILADYDVDLLVQLSLDTLISEYVLDPGLAHQTRRETRGDGQADAAR